MQVAGHSGRPRWSARISSVEGASHRRSGAPNQDAVACSLGPNEPPSRTVVLALSDGHGSQHCFRSEIGSKLAVDSAVDKLSEFLATWSHRTFDEIDHEVQTRLIEDLAKHWALTVGQHRKDNPFTEDQAHLLRSKIPGRNLLEPLSDVDASLAYGATLLAVAVGDGFIVFLQLGDGEILIVPDAPGAVEPAMPEDPNLIADETTSLCMPSAQKYFRYRFMRTEAAPPRLIVASTDGYPNSFKLRADFLQVGTDLRDGIHRNGLAANGDALDGWLRQASDEGSGDDATIGLIWRDGDEPAAPCR